MRGFPGGSVGKESACNAGGLGLILGLGRSPGGGHGNPPQYSCLENPLGQRSLAGCSSWGQRVGYDWASECEVWSRCGFNVYFPNDSWCQASFQVFFCINTLSRECKNYSHTTLKSLNFIWSTKLSRVGPGWYFSGRPPENSRCYRLKKQN